MCAWPKQLLSVDCCFSHSGSEQPWCLSKYIFIGHDTTTEAVRVFSAALCKSLAKCHLLSAENSQRIDSVVMETRATIYKKNSNDLWSLTPDRITFLLAVARASLLCQRWQAFMITIFISVQNKIIPNKHAVWKQTTAGRKIKWIIKNSV